MKKICFSILIILLCFPLLVSAETLDEYIAQAEAKLKQEREATEQKEMTEEEKEEALAEKEEITNEISSIENEIATLEDEIEELEEAIEKKDDEIKQLMSFVQITSGEMSYLEYIFGATDFTDFIYRISVAEQLSSYNENLMEEYTKAVEEQEAKQEELDQKQEDLTAKNKELQELINELSAKIEELNDNVQTYQAEYDNLMSYINTLQEMGCQGDWDMETCEAKANMNPPAVNTNVSSGSSSSSSSSSSGSVISGVSSGFYIPLTQGRVTQNYYGSSHNAIDITNYEGAPVYAITTGKVITISRNQSCGKNIVYILHNVDGQDYTTVYYHLKTVTVSVGDTVYYTTQIGTQGGNPSYDSCSTGSHLDFKLFKGRYLTDFFSLSSGPHMDPRNWLTQLPGEGSYFSSR